MRFARSSATSAGPCDTNSGRAACQVAPPQPSTRTRTAPIEAADVAPIEAIDVAPIEAADVDADATAEGVRGGGRGARRCACKGMRSANEK